MKISKIIEQLQELKNEHGDIEGLIEVDCGYGCSLIPIDELNFEHRYCYGDSVSFLA